MNKQLYGVIEFDLQHNDSNTKEMKSFKGIDCPKNNFELLIFDGLRNRVCRAKFFAKPSGRNVFVQLN